MTADSVWRVVEDDSRLAWAAPAAGFLQSFCPPEADPVWSESYFHWKLGAANPAGTGFLSIAESDGQIVGTTTITAKRLWVGGREIAGGEIGDTYTAEEFRRGGRPATLHRGTPQTDAYVNKSLFGRLVTETRERAEAQGRHVIYGTPNANSMPGYVSRLGFVAAGWANRNYVRPMPAGIARRIPVLAPLTGILGALDRIWTGSGRRRGIEIGTIATARGEIDELWLRARAKIPFGLVQDRAWLQHRFFDHPLARYAVRTASRDGRLAAFMVSRTYHAMNGRPTTAIADWLSEPDAGVCLSALAREIVQEARAMRSEQILLWTRPDSALATLCRPLGFLERGESPVIVASNPSLLLGITEADVVAHFSLASSDNV